MDPILSKRLIEASLFTAKEPMERADLYTLVGEETDLDAVMAALVCDYEGHGVVLERTGTRFAFRTAPDLASLLTPVQKTVRKLPKAALETLAIIAYHQPATRGDIEDLRGVSVARGTIDLLLEQGWIAPTGRRDTPGRPVEWGTTPEFLDHFGLTDVEALPGVQDLRSAGLLDGPGPQIYGVMEDSHLNDETEDYVAEEEAKAELRPGEEG